MSERGGLADLGFLGGSFQWWMGQVCEASTWRDNILDHKFDNPESIKGWGYRYKVRIMGMHPKSNDTLPSEKLKFASVMYGVTDGGGQGGTLKTPGIRPGNFVFGFFMDAHEENEENPGGAKINDWHTRHEDQHLEVYCDNHPDSLECRVYDD